MQADHCSTVHVLDELMIRMRVMVLMMMVRMMLVVIRLKMVIVMMMGIQKKV